jgi:hypothetical protein
MPWKDISSGAESVLGYYHSSLRDFLTDRQFLAKSGNFSKATISRKIWKLQGRLQARPDEMVNSDQHSVDGSPILAEEDVVNEGADISAGWRFQ